MLMSPLNENQFDSHAKATLPPNHTHTHTRSHFHCKAERGVLTGFRGRSYHRCTFGVKSTSHSAEIILVLMKDNHHRAQEDFTVPDCQNRVSFTPSRGSSNSGDINFMDDRHVSMTENWKRRVWMPDRQRWQSMINCFLLVIVFNTEGKMDTHWLVFPGWNHDSEEGIVLASRLLAIKQ